MTAFSGKKVILFLNHDIGLKILRYLVMDDKVQIAQVYLVNTSNEINSEIYKVCQLNQIETFTGREIIEDINHLRIVTQKNVDFIISVYWPWLINDAYLATAKDSLNFHPALLPKNRGWYPHVHNLLNGTPAGVTLHRMSSVADAGDVWAQKETFVSDTDNAKDLYERLKQDIYDLFIEIWPNFLQGVITPLKQDERQSSYNKKNALDEIDKIDLDEMSSFKNMINLLRARTFGHKPYAYFIQNGKKVYVQITLHNEEFMES